MSDEIRRLRPPRRFHNDLIIRPYNHQEAEGYAILQVMKDIWICIYILVTTTTIIHTKLSLWKSNYGTCLCKPRSIHYSCLAVDQFPSFSLFAFSVYSYFAFLFLMCQNWAMQQFVIFYAKTKTATEWYMLIEVDGGGVICTCVWGGTRFLFKRRW